MLAHDLPALLADGRCASQSLTLIQKGQEAEVALELRGLGVDLRTLDWLESLEEHLLGKGHLLLVKLLLHGHRTGRDLLHSH